MGQYGCVWLGMGQYREFNSRYLKFFYKIKHEAKQLNNIGVFHVFHVNRSVKIFSLHRKMD